MFLLRSGLSLSSSLDGTFGRCAMECPERAELVKLRYFVGLSIPDAAEALGISESTAKRQWTYARAWLFWELKGLLKR